MDILLNIHPGSEGCILVSSFAYCHDIMMLLILIDLGRDKIPCPLISI